MVRIYQRFLTIYTVKWIRVLARVDETCTFVSTKYDGNMNTIFWFCSFTYWPLFKMQKYPDFNIVMNRKPCSFASCVVELFKRKIQSPVSMYVTKYTFYVSNKCKIKETTCTCGNLWLWSILNPNSSLCSSRNFYTEFHAF